MVELLWNNYQVLRQRVNEKSVIDSKMIPKNVSALNVHGPLMHGSKPSALIHNARNYDPSKF